MTKLTGRYLVLLLGLLIFGCSVRVFPVATIHVEAKGMFYDKLSTVKKVALNLGFEPLDVASYNNFYSLHGSGVLAVQVYRLPSRPNLKLVVEFFPSGRGPYGGAERWFDVVLADGTVEGETELKGVALEKLIDLVEMLRKEFGREFIIIRHPKIDGPAKSRFWELAPQ